MDLLTNLMNAQRAFHKAESEFITTNPTLAETDEENHSNSYKWIRLPIVDEQPETISDMLLSNVEEFPNDCLAGILAEGLKNGVPKGIRLWGLNIDNNGSSFHFCISGSISLKELRILCEQYRASLCPAEKK